MIFAPTARLRALAPKVACALAIALTACGDSGGPIAKTGSASSGGGSSGGSPQPACATVSREWQGQASNIFRTGVLSQGEFIYTNGLWQARGANSDQLARTQYYAPAPADDPGFVKRDLYLAMTYDFFGSHRGTHNGDYQLPTNAEQWPEGTADLVELRMAATATELRIRFLWNSFARPDAQIATLAFANAATPMSNSGWPRNAKFASPYSAVLNHWGTGAELRMADGSLVPVAVAVGDHSSEACIPLSQLPSGPWTLSGGAGLADPANPMQYWTVPTGQATATTPASGGPVSPTNVWSLLFANDTPWSFDELAQSAALTAASSNASVTVDPAQLQAAVSQPLPERTGRFSRLLVSKFFEQDGITKDRSGIAPIAPPAGTQPPPSTPDFNVSYFYTGRFQPYAMNVPAAYAESSSAYPLIVYLHGFTGLPEEPFHNPVGLTEMAEQEGYLFASALGRGDYFYMGEGEADVLEVIADVRKHYRVDADRIYLMGHSMGGFGSNNVGSRNPDLFAAIAPAQGTDAQHLFRNFRNLPWFIMTSDQDLDANAQEALGLYGLLSGAGYDATVLQYRTKIHEYSSIYDTLPRLFRYFASHRRNANPAIVSYTQRPSEIRTDLGLLHDSAYWMSRLLAASDAADATVELESFGIPHAPDNPAAATRSDAAVDEGGPTLRTLAQLKQTTPAVAAPMPARNALRISASNLARVRVDLARAALALNATGLSISSNSERAYLLELAGPASNARVRVGNGNASPVSFADGSAQIMVPSGAVELVVTSP